MCTRLPVEPASIRMPKVVASSRSTTSYFVCAAAPARSRSRRRRIGGARIGAARARAAGLQARFAAATSPSQLALRCSSSNRRSVATAVCPALRSSTLLLRPMQRDSNSQNRRLASVLHAASKKIPGDRAARFYAAERLPEEQGQPRHLRVRKNERVCSPWQAWESEEPAGFGKKSQWAL